MTIRSDEIRRTYPEGVPCWVDTVQQDVDAATEFYGGLFGWTFQDVMPPGTGARYVIAQLDGHDVGAIAGPLEATAAWNTYVAVDDADAAVRRLVSAGASIRSAPADAGEGGRGAVLVDPEGAEFRIWQARRRLGAQAVNLPGAWNFSDLHTTDPAAAVAFYRAGVRLGGRRSRFRDDDPTTRLRRPPRSDHRPGHPGTTVGSAGTPGVCRCHRLGRLGRPGPAATLARLVHGGGSGSDSGGSRTTWRADPRPGGDGLDPNRPDPRPPRSGVHGQPVHPAVQLAGDECADLSRGS